MSKRKPGRPVGSKNKPALAFKKTEVDRAIRAANERGLDVTSIEVIPREGRIIVNTARRAASEA